jgi:hypothetical protein
MYRVLKPGGFLSLSTKRAGPDGSACRPVLQSGRLKAEKFDQAWMITPADLAAFKKLDRPHGRHRTPARKAGRKKK